MKWIFLSRTAAIAFAWILMILAISSTWAQDNPKPQIGAARPEMVSARRSGGPHQDVKVHGHWLIVIRDKDGKEVDRREFENSLRAGQGQQQLASLLGRYQAIGNWLILLGNSGSGSQPCTGASGGCGIMEQQPAQLPSSDDQWTVGLAVKYDPTTTPTIVQLVGTTRATNNGVINTVHTLLGLCPPGPPSPTGCLNTQTFRFFSDASSLAGGGFAAVNVANGQAIDVIVTYSFN